MHSKETPRWGSPSDLVERARRVMGAIDLDPCSESAFQRTVQASRYYSLTERDEDGLKLPWFGRVYCNPPGGIVLPFWRRLVSEPIEQGVWCGFSLNQLGRFADEEFQPEDFSFCRVRKRIKFLYPDGTVSTSPSHFNYVCGVRVDPNAFDREFGPLGRVSHGRLAMSFKESAA
jgi:hypothetical protein